MEQMPTSVDTMNGLTVVHFAVIGLFALFMVFVIIWGMKLRARRRAAEQELEERGALVATEAAEAPATAPVADEAPTPDHLADEPIAAAAPLEASPAAEAAVEPAPAAEAAPEPVPVAAATADDLTRMKGVGPRLAERLNSVGITSFAQIAALTPAEATALDAQLGNFQGRLGRDRWIEQAGYLAKDDAAGFEAVFGKL